MTYRLALPAALLLLSGPAWGQVSVDSRALEQLSQPAPAAPHHAAPEHKPAAKPAAHPATGRTTSTPTPNTDKAGAEKHVATTRAAPVPPPKPPTAPTPPKLPTIPVAPPAIANLPPPAKVPTRPPGAPPVIPLAADAPGLASKINGGMRVTFGPDRADLNNSTVGALRSIAHVAQASPDTPVNVLAYASGTPEDPSTPRRLSLSRALAARAVLVNEGIPSTRIYVRALGSNNSAGGPADRVDVTLGGDGAPGGPPSGAAATAATAPAQPATTSPSAAQ